ncbi:MAG: leucine-rich repeat domain-containing protein [Clostridia bacterium]|nr:leucine-rich repeat domain-containing protein [Clostridia bacterium]
MRKVVCLFIGIILCLCLSLCLAEGEWTPPEGKTEGAAGGLCEDSMSGVYICDTAATSWSAMHLFEPGHEYEQDYGELVTDAGIEFVSGDEYCKDFFTWIKAGNPEDGMVFEEHLDRGLDGKPSRKARFRIHAETEHYYTQFEFDAEFLSKNEVSVTLGLERVQIPVGEKTWMSSVVKEESIIISPEGIYDSVGIMTPEGESYIETDDYKVGNPAITLKKTGEYPMILLVRVGENQYETPFPITVEGVEGEATEETPADSGPNEAAVKEEKEVGETEEEKPGNDASDDMGLTLKLDLGDREFTVYAGSKECHLAFWDIVDYEKLSAAWGGEPGWSIMPAEGSADVMRWSNASVDGKSVWAFCGGNQVAEVGDYISTITCNWHGQSASAKITVHVEESPNGLLEGISGLEESYTMTLGETLNLNLQTIPEGWSLPGEKPRFMLTSVRSTLDDQYSGNDKGNPYFNIILSDDLGPVSITAWRSGVYRLGFQYRCGSFTESLDTTINVCNEDGTVPQSAEEITEMEGTQWGYDTAANRGTGETYAIITGGKARKDLVIPAEVDGYPVRMIGQNAFTDYNTPGAAETVETLTIEEGVAVIDYGAFSDLTGLRSVTLPDSVILIENNAFEGCRNLTEIRLPAAMTTEQIKTGAFENIGLEDLTLDDGTSLLAASLKQGRDYISTYADGWAYQKLEDGTVRLTEWVDRDWQATELTIPDTVGGYPVSTLKEGLLSYNSNVQKVALPESLRVIEKEAFRNCEALAEVNLPEGLLEVGECAFVNVTAKGLTLPEGARERSATLWYCENVRMDTTGSFEYGILEDGTAVISFIPNPGKSIEIPAEVDGIKVTGIAQISRQSMDYEVRKQITSVKLPEGLKFIGREAFSSYDALKTVNIPEGVTEIGDEAFRSCSALGSVTFPSTLKKIGDEAFEYIPLTRIDLPEGLESIGDEAFMGQECKEITIPASVKSVGHKAFSPNGDKPPKKVTFLSPLTEIGKGLFGYNSTDLFNNPLNRTAMGYEKYIDRYSDDPDGWNDLYADAGSRSADAITIACYPGSTADLKYQYNVKKEYLKWGEEHIRTAPADRVLQAGLYQKDEIIYELLIPEGVEEIAEGAFAGMRTLSKVTLPSTLTAIGARAFEGCSGLAELTIPESVTTMGEAIFYGCVSLKSVTLPAAIEVIPNSLFEGCGKLETLKTKAKAITVIGDRAFKNCQALAKFDLKKGLTEIGEEAFRSTAITKAQIPDTVTKIGKEAFRNTQLTSISFPKEMEEIPEGVCYYAAALKDIKLPAAVKKIGKLAFAYTDPTNLNLPEGLVEIGEGAFADDASRAQYYYKGSGGKKTWTKLKVLKLPASLEIIGDLAFSSRDAVTSITFAKNSQLKQIGKQAFAMLVHLKEITLPDSLQSIGYEAFVNCIEMKKADLGAGVTSIGEEAFLQDDALVSLKVPDSATELGDKIIEGHGSGLTVTCGEGSAFETYMKNNYPDVAIEH